MKRGGLVFLFSVVIVLGMNLCIGGTVEPWYCGGGYQCGVEVPGDLNRFQLNPGCEDCYPNCGYACSDPLGECSECCVGDLCCNQTGCSYKGLSFNHDRDCVDRFPISDPDHVYVCDTDYPDDLSLTPESYPDGEILGSQQKYINPFIPGVILEKETYAWGFYLSISGLNSVSIGGSHLDPFESCSNDLLAEAYMYYDEQSNIWYSDGDWYDCEKGCAPYLTDFGYCYYPCNDSDKDFEDTGIGDSVYVPGKTKEKDYFLGVDEYDSCFDGNTVTEWRCDVSGDNERTSETFDCEYECEEKYVEGFALATGACCFLGTWDDDWTDPESNWGDCISYKQSRLRTCVCANPSDGCGGVEGKSPCLSDCITKEGTATPTGTEIETRDCIPPIEIINFCSEYETETECGLYENQVAVVSVEAFRGEGFCSTHNYGSDNPFYTYDGDYGMNCEVFVNDCLCAWNSSIGDEGVCTQALETSIYCNNLEVPKSRGYCQENCTTEGDCQESLEGDIDIYCDSTWIFNDPLYLWDSLDQAEQDAINSFCSSSLEQTVRIACADARINKLGFFGWINFIIAVFCIGIVYFVWKKDKN